MLPPDHKNVPQQGVDATPGTAVQTLPAELGCPLPPPVLSASPSMGTLMQAFRRAWRLAIVVAFLGTALTVAAIWFIVPPQYSSVVVLRVNSRPPHPSLEDASNLPNNQKNQIAIVKSFDVLSDAIKKSDVEQLYGVRYSPRPLAKELTASFNESPEVLTIELSGENPEAVAALLNAIGDVYAQRVNAADEARIRDRVAELRHRLRLDPDRKDAARTPTLAEQLRDKRIEVAQAEKAAGLDDEKTRAAKFAHAQAMLAAAQQSLLNRRQDRDGWEEELKSKRARANDPPPPIISTAEAEDALRGDPSFAEVMKQIGDIESQIAYIRRVSNAMAAESQVAKYRRKLAGLKDTWRSMVREAREKLEEVGQVKARETIRAEINTLSDKIKSSEKQDLSLQNEIKRWAAEVENHRPGAARAPPEVENLRDQVKQLEKEYQRVGDELAGLEVPLNPRVRRHADAFVPSERDYVKPIKYSAAGGVLMFGLLVVGVCLLEARGRRVYGSEDVGQGLGLPVIGTLPRLPQAARNQSAQAQVIAGQDSLYGLTEAVDAIRTVLMHSPHIDGARVVMVTSAAGGEGKTTLASHLAASLSRAWRKTLLIDGDLRNPAQHTQFGQPLEPGLCEALRGEVEFADVIKETPVSRLWVMPAGKVDPHALQALAQEGLATVFEALKEHYDFIVLDTSPVLPVPDALLLGKQSDVVLLSVMRDVSRMPTVYQAQQRLESLGIRLLGAVVIGEKTEAYGRKVPYPQASGK